MQEFIAGLLIVVPWLVGFLLLKTIKEPDETSLLADAGDGYLVGWLIVVASYHLAKFMDTAPTSFIYLVTVCFSFFVAILIRRLTSKGVRHARHTKRWAGKSIYLATGVALMTLMGLPLYVRLQLTLPILPWDALMNWLPKAHIWFNLGFSSDFVSPDVWLNASGEENKHTLANKMAWAYPETVPLILLYMMSYLGDTESPLIFIPWLLIPFSMALSICGRIDSGGYRWQLFILTLGVLMSVPQLSIHAIQPGYADIWLAAYFGVACLVLSNFIQTKSAANFFLLLILGLGCVSVKRFGFVFCGLLVVVLIMHFILDVAQKRRKAGYVMLSSAAAVCVFLGLTTYVFMYDQAGTANIPYLGTVTIALNNALPYFFHTMFISLDWGILWYAMVICVAVQAVKLKSTPKLNHLLILIACTLAVLLVVFSFSQFFTTARDYTSLNRGIMVLIVPVSSYIIAVLVAIRTVSSDTGESTQEVVKRNLDSVVP